MQSILSCQIRIKGVDYPRNIQFQESSWLCGRLPTKRRIELEGSTLVYLLSAVASLRTDTGIDDILFSVLLVFFDVAGKRDRVVDAVLSDLLGDFGRIRENLLNHVHVMWW